MVAPPVPAPYGRPMSKKSRTDEKSLADNQDQPAYMVLARKYRPGSFDELIGQNAMVQTLANAFRLGRIAQGFMLTGVRGVGKTTTARILARALNYETKEGGAEQGPTIDMPEPGVHCEAIMESRHVDVLEMDAAFHTGVDDIREIIESTRYKPISARYKVYIIDEVHMLSKSAFNALLKTLEEPPEHVKFIFATTEVQKVPVTVLSRCQRFDLKRIEMEELTKHFARISEKEGARIDEAALALIAQAAEGSVRDGLSILDQAIAHVGGEGEDKVSVDEVRLMLGLADRLRIFDLLEAVLKGDAAAAIKQAGALFVDGADPVRILVDLSESVHILTRRKILEDEGARALSEAERARAAQMAEKLSMPVLGRCWQMVLKGIEECGRAPNQMAALEMILVRIAYAADLPSPEELARILDEGANRSLPVQNDGQASAVSQGAGVQTRGRQELQGRDSRAGGRAETVASAAQKRNAPLKGEADNPICSFEDLAELIGREGGLVLKMAFEEYVKPVSFATGAIEIALAAGAPRGLANDIKRVLQKSTGENWIVAVSEQQGGQTLHEQKQQAYEKQLAEVKQHPLVKAALRQFPGARISDIRDIDRAEQAPGRKIQQEGE